MKTLILAVVCGVVSLLTISCKKSPTESVVKTEVRSEDVLTEAETVLERNRFALRTTWFKDAREVAEKTKNEEAKSIASFMEENSALAEPDLQGSRFLETANGSLWFILVPIVVGDNSKGPMWQAYYSKMGSGGVANFQPDVRAIVIKSHIKMTPTWRGIVLLHEGRHAKEFITRQYDWQDPETYCNEERDTHDLQNLLVMGIGGEKYKTFVNTLAEEMEAELKEKGFSPGEASVSRSKNYPELDEIFSPSLSTLERDFRETSVWIHANFLMLEKKFKNKADEKKSLFLKTRYASKGILPSGN